MNTETFTIPLIGDIAPHFEAQTTEGALSFPEDYKGSWTILFSHPGDFTPVCTTEFLGFQELKPEFDKRNVKLLGFSVDGIHSHIAWLKNMEANFDVKIEFPIASGHHIAQKYGMIHPNADKMATVRAVFIISPGGVIAAVMYYPLANGRNIYEIVRLVDSLQLSYNEGKATPANWPHNKVYGNKVIVPPVKTLAEANTIKEKYPDCKDWYICATTNPNE